LEVRTDNERAIALCGRKGLQTEGRMRKELTVGGDDYDNHLMGPRIP
jgi:hypothetical protein